uniref:Uncharacterized protein n=1 Tax=Bionectria ochroleuca TaxID=29856 RepID=A0A0B7JHJ9_BIOOC
MFAHTPLGGPSSRGVVLDLLQWLIFRREAACDDWGLIASETTKVAEVDSVPPAIKDTASPVRRLRVFSGGGRFELSRADNIPRDVPEDVKVAFEVVNQRSKIRLPVVLVKVAIAVAEAIVRYDVSCKTTVRLHDGEWCGILTGQDFIAQLFCG